MSIYKTSNHSPNLSEIDMSQDNNFTCMVNTNGESIRAYKLQILSEGGDKILYDQNTPTPLEAPITNKEILTIPHVNADIVKFLPKGEFYYSDQELTNKIGELKNYNTTYEVVNDYYSTININNHTYYVKTPIYFETVLDNGKNYQWGVRTYNAPVGSTERPNTLVCEGYLPGSTKYVIWSRIQKDNNLRNKLIEYFSGDRSGNINEVFKDYSLKTRMAAQEIKDKYDQLFGESPTAITEAIDRVVSDDKQRALDQLIYDRYIQFTDINSQDLVLSAKEDPNVVLPETPTYTERKKIDWTTHELGVDKDFTKIETTEPFKYNYKDSTKYEIYQCSDEHTVNSIFVDPNSNVNISDYIIIYNNIEDALKAKESEDGPFTINPVVAPAFAARKIVGYSSDTGEIRVHDAFNYAPTNGMAYRIFRQNVNTGEYTEAVPVDFSYITPPSTQYYKKHGTIVSGVKYYSDFERNNVQGTIPSGETVHYNVINGQVSAIIVEERPDTVTSVPLYSDQALTNKVGMISELDHLRYTVLPTNTASSVQTSIRPLTISANTPYYYDQDLELQAGVTTADEEVGYTVLNKKASVIVLKAASTVAKRGTKFYKDKELTTLRGTLENSTKTYDVYPDKLTAGTKYYSDKALTQEAGSLAASDDLTYRIIDTKVSSITKYGVTYYVHTPEMISNIKYIIIPLRPEKLDVGTRYYSDTKCTQFVGTLSNSDDLSYTVITDLYSEITKNGSKYYVVTPNFQETKCYISTPEKIDTSFFIATPEEVSGTYYISTPAIESVVRYIDTPKNAIAGYLNTYYTTTAMVNDNILPSTIPIGTPYYSSPTLSETSFLGYLSSSDNLSYVYVNDYYCIVSKDSTERYVHTPKGRQTPKGERGKIIIGDEEFYVGHDSVIISNGLNTFTNNIYTSQLIGGSPIFTEYYTTITNRWDDTAHRLFIQPNINIKTDTTNFDEIVFDNGARVDIVKQTRYNEISQKILDVTINELDNTQWLIEEDSLSLAYGNIPTDKNNNIQPQTDYTVYTDFMDSSPYNLFYARKAPNLTILYRNAEEKIRYGFLGGDIRIEENMPITGTLFFDSEGVDYSSYPDLLGAYLYYDVRNNYYYRWNGVLFTQFRKNFVKGRIKNPIAYYQEDGSLGLNYTKTIYSGKDFIQDVLSVGSKYYNNYNLEDYSYVGDITIEDNVDYEYINTYYSKYYKGPKTYAQLETNQEQLLQDKDNKDLYLISNIFYVHTPVVTPKVDEIYYDVDTKLTYTWNGEYYVLTSEVWHYMVNDINSYQSFREAEFYTKWTDDYGNIVKDPQIKFYQYSLYAISSGVDGETTTLIKESKDLYDIDVKWIFRGLDGTYSSPTKYLIKVKVVDEYDKVYLKENIFYIKYNINVATSPLNITLNCDEQSTTIVAHSSSFVGSTDFEEKSTVTNLNINRDKKELNINMGQVLNYTEMVSTSSDIYIPKNFNMLTQFTLSEEFLDSIPSPTQIASVFNSGEKEIFTVSHDLNSGIVGADPDIEEIICTVTNFNPYYLYNNVLYTNKEIGQLKLYKKYHGVQSRLKYCFERNGVITDFIDLLEVMNFDINRYALQEEGEEYIKVSELPTPSKALMGKIYVVDGINSKTVNGLYRVSESSPGNFSWIPAYDYHYLFLEKTSDLVGSTYDSLHVPANARGQRQASQGDLLFNDGNNNLWLDAKYDTKTLDLLSKIISLYLKVQNGVITCLYDISKGGE